MRRRLTFSRRTIFGASLLEVLIALTLVSGGVMATALLYISSLKYSKIAQVRGIAADLAMELADRMRANPQIVYEFDDDYDDTAEPVAIPPCDGSCTPNDIAAIDIAEMRNRVVQALPGGWLRIVPDGTSANIWVMWTDPETSGDDDASLQCQGAGDGAGPRCVSMRVSL